MDQKMHPALGKLNSADRSAKSIVSSIGEKNFPTSFTANGRAVEILPGLSLPEVSEELQELTGFSLRHIEWDKPTKKDQLWAFLRNSFNVWTPAFSSL